MTINVNQHKVLRSGVKKKKAQGKGGKNLWVAVVCEVNAVHGCVGTSTGSEREGALQGRTSHTALRVSCVICAPQFKKNINR